VNFEGLSPEQAASFAAEWLPAWTGNNPERLAAFYSEDAFYSDPAVPQGLQGRDAILAHFRKLLGRNPDWVWTQIGAVPMEGGFVNKWRAVIPVGTSSLTVEGVCLVWLRSRKIVRNEVYFDRSDLLAAIVKNRKI